MICCLYLNLLKYLRIIYLNCNLYDNDEEHLLEFILIYCKVMFFLLIHNVSLQILYGKLSILLPE